MSRPVLTKSNKSRWMGILIAGIVLLVALGAVLIPLLLGVSKHNRQLELAKIDYARKLTLVPVYAELKSLKLPELPMNLAPDKRAPIEQDAFDELPLQITELVRESQLEMQGFTPRVHMHEDGKKYMSLEVVVAGLFESFQGFLSELSRLPAFYTMHNVAVRKLALGDELSVELWLYVE